MTVWIAVTGWRGDYRVLGVYADQAMAEARATQYNEESKFEPGSGNAASVEEREVIPVS